MPDFLRGFLKVVVPGLVLVALLVLALSRVQGGQAGESNNHFPNLKLYAQYVEDPNGIDSAYLMVFTMPNGHKLVCIDSTTMECNFDVFNKESGRG